MIKDLIGKRFRADIKENTDMYVTISQYGQSDREIKIDSVNVNEWSFVCTDIEADMPNPDDYTVTKVYHHTIGKTERYGMLMGTCIFSDKTMLIHATWLESELIKSNRVECTCDIGVLMNVGCKCGALQQERAINKGQQYEVVIYSIYIVRMYNIK